ADDRLLAPADGLDRPVGEHRRDRSDGVEALDLNIGIGVAVGGGVGVGVAVGVGVGVAVGVGVDNGLDLDDLVLQGGGLGLGRAHGLVLFWRGHCATWWISYGVGF